MKKILIISFSNLQKDPRVFRQINLLRNSYNVTTVGLHDSGLDGVVFYKCRSKNYFDIIKKVFFMLFHFYEKAFWQNPEKDVLNQMKGLNFDLIIANDIYAMPLAVKLKNKAKIIFDAHEYYPKYGGINIKWILLFRGYNKYLCKKYIKLSDKAFTVSNGIALEYEKKYNIKPEIVTNAPDFIELKPSFKDKKLIKIIHHGLASPTRRIEDLIKIADYLDDRFILNLMLIPSDKKYYKKIMKMISDKSNIKLLPPVQMSEIIKFSNQFDIGLMFFRPITFNLKYTLPNKFFEYIQSRLMIATGPSIETINIINNYDCGIISKDFNPKSLADKLSELTLDKIEYYKNQSDKAALTLSSISNYQKMNLIVKNLIEV